MNQRALHADANDECHSEGTEVEVVITFSAGPKMRTVCLEGSTK
jgi:hypothetical protein